MRKFKSIVIVYWILVIAGMAGGFLMLTGWSYPLKQVSKPLAECKSVRWEDMPDGCMIDLPKIVGADSAKYKDDNLYRLIYSDLWGGTYDDGWDTSSGSSPGMDIVTSKGTPVYAIADGTVVQAGYKFGIGNSVTIKHAYKGGFIYSSYSHLDEFYVKVGDTISEGMLIGKVGNTGTTMGQYGNHLDFQITTTTWLSYPYSYHDCNVGLSYHDIINTALCRSYMLANTMDPVLLLESNSAVGIIKGASDRIQTSSNKVVTPTSNKTITESQDSVVLPVAPSAPAGVHEAASLLSTTSSTNTVKKYQYQVIGLNAKENVEVKRKFVFFIKIYDNQNQQLFKGKLANHLVLRDDKGIIAFDKPVVTTVSNGIVKVTALGLKKGNTDLKVEIAGTSIGSYNITLN